MARIRFSSVPLGSLHYYSPVALFSSISRSLPRSLSLFLSFSGSTVYPRSTANIPSSSRHRRWENTFVSTHRETSLWWRAKRYSGSTIRPEFQPLNVRNNKCKNSNFVPHFFKFSFKFQFFCRIQSILWIMKKAASESVSLRQINLLSRSEQRFLVDEWT